MKLKLWLLAAAASGICLTGCQNTVNTVENTEKAMNANHVTNSRFTTDVFLRNRLVLGKITTGRTADGFMRVQVEAINARTGIFAQLWSGITGENPYRIRYKFTWFDQQGMAMDSIVSDWQDATVIPGETLYLQSVAPSKDCSDFKVSLREADNN